jgi:cation transport regulator
MPYRSIKDLPDSVKNNLPIKAQRIYMRVYNSAYEKYNNPARVAWGVVKKQYVKSKDGRWKKKSTHDTSSSSSSSSSDYSDIETDYETDD